MLEGNARHWKRQEQSLWGETGLLGKTKDETFTLGRGLLCPHEKAWMETLLLGVTCGARGLRAK